MKGRHLRISIACLALAACGGDPFDLGGNDEVEPPVFSGENPCDDGPLADPIPNCAPEAMPSTRDPAQDCVDRINQLRWECQCLPPLGRWTGGEACAEEHAQYDSERNEAHAGFSADICDSGGWAQNECPGWGSIERTVSGCLQAMWDEGPGPWGPEHGHYINMTNPDYSMVACGFHTTGEGRVWAVQNFQ